MKGYAEITTQEQMDALLRHAAGFHDSMAKELHVLNRGWVDDDGAMTMEHRFDARVLVHTQWPPVAIELLFINVRALRTSDAGEFWAGTGHVSTGESSGQVTLSFDGQLEITADRLFYADRPTWTGAIARLGHEIPHPDCVPAMPLDVPWRQCSSCREAFKGDPDVSYLICPKCRLLTELVGNAAEQAPGSDVGPGPPRSG